MSRLEDRDSTTPSFHHRHHITSHHITSHDITLAKDSARHRHSVENSPLGALGAKAIAAAIRAKRVTIWKDFMVSINLLCYLIALFVYGCVQDLPYLRSRGVDSVTKLLVSLRELTCVELVPGDLSTDRRDLSVRWCWGGSGVRNENVLNLCETTRMKFQTAIRGQIVLRMLIPVFVLVACMYVQCVSI